MTKSARRLERAIRIVPAEDRGRYAPEWRGDLESATQVGVGPEDIVKGATKVAWRLRERQVERLLTGRRGAAPALLAWLGVALLLAAAFLFGSILLALAVVVLAALVWLFCRAGSPTHWSHWLMCASAVVWVVCFGFFWWVLGVALNASDSFQPVPSYVTFGGPALIGAGVAAVAFIASVAVAVSRSRNHHR